MKKIVMIALVLLLSGVCICYSGPFDAQDEEAEKLALTVRNLLGGDSYENSIKETYPKSKLSWGGRIVPGTGATVTYVIYCEVKTEKGETYYYYYELAVAEINTSPELKSKYGIK